jgi:hypothetical protein
MKNINQAMNEAAKRVLDKMTRDLFLGSEATTSTTASDNSNLTWGSIERTYQLLKSLESPVLYYALSEFMPDKTKFYKMPVEGGEKELWMMHPDKFPQFEFEAIRAGYRLVDYRTLSTKRLLHLPDH